MKRPSGLKGPMKVVDPRMKKDNRKQRTVSNAKNNRDNKKSKVFKQAGGRKKKR